MRMMRPSQTHSPYSSYRALFLWWPVSSVIPIMVPIPSHILPFSQPPPLPSKELIKKRRKRQLLRILQRHPRRRPIACGTGTTTCCLEGQYCDVDLLCHDRETRAYSRQYCSDPDWPSEDCSGVCSRKSPPCPCMNCVGGDWCGYVWVCGG